MIQADPSFLTSKMPGVDGFQLVTRRKRFNRRYFGNRLDNLSNLRHIEPELDTEQLLRQVLDTVVILQDSPYREVLCNGLTVSLSILGVDVIPEIVCYGLGNFSHNRSSKYQLAVLLTLKACYRSRVYLYDPVFYAKEIEVFKALGLSMIETNEEAKRKACDTLTLFYMPHCYKGLVANCIWANWDDGLSKCILMTNSFKEMADDCFVRDKDLKASVELIKQIRPYTMEITLEHKFTPETYDAFACTSIHVFPKENLVNVPEDFWKRLDAAPFTFVYGFEQTKD